MSHQSKVIIDKLTGHFNTCREFFLLPHVSGHRLIIGCFLLPCNGAHLLCLLCRTLTACNFWGTLTQGGARFQRGLPWASMWGPFRALPLCGQGAKLHQARPLPVAQQASSPQRQQALVKWASLRRRRSTMLNPSLQAGVAGSP